MSRELVGILGIAVTVVLMLTGMPIGFIFCLVGFAGVAYFTSLETAFHVAGTKFFDTFSSYDLTVIPLFVLMGYFAFNAGLTQRLFDAGYKCFGQVRGGLYMGTIAASTAFAACCGSSVAGVATMGTVALPEMRRHGYDDGLAGGCVAAAGSLAVLIPPSITLVIYGILTEQSIGQLFVAGIIPGIVLALLFMLAIYIITRIKPELGPPGPPSSFKEKVSALVFGSGEIALLFVVLMGGLFVGFFTPTEAGAMGAAAMFLITIVRGKLGWKGFVHSIQESLRTAAMIVLIIAGAGVFNSFIAYSRLPFAVADWVGGLPLPPDVVMLLIVFVYMILGCFMDTLAMILLTIPIFFPVAQQLGFDPIWFGVIIVVVCEMGLITPPVGISVFVVKGIMPDIPLYTIFRGIYPFLIAQWVLIFILLFFPEVATYLPHHMTL